MKNVLRSLLGLSLILALVLSLAACGQKEESKGEEHPDTVFTSETVRVDSPEVKDGLYPLLYTEDGFYGQAYDSEAVEAYYQGMDRGAEALEGEEPAAQDAEAAEDSEEAEETPETNVPRDNGMRLLFVRYDGSTRAMSAYQPLAEPKDPGDKTNFYSGSGLNALLQKEDGSLLSVENTYMGWFDGTEEEMRRDTPDTWEKYRNSQEYYLRSLNEDGSEKDCIKLDFNDENVWLDFSSAQFDEQGNLLVPGDQVIYGFSPDGSVCLQIPMDNYVERMLKLRDGSIAVMSWGDKGMCLLPVDLNTKKLGQEIAIPEQADNLRPGDENYDFYYTNGMYLYGYRVDTEENSKLLNWLDVDVNGSEVSNFFLRQDGSLMCVLNQYRNEHVNTDIVRIYQVPYDSLPQKTTLTLAVMYGDMVFDKVIDFNRHSDTVRIQVVDYAEFNDPENDDFEAGRTKLLTEVMSGQMPDLIAVNQLPYTQMAAKGLLEDLYPYLDADKQLKREDFFPNALEALEINGGLYQVTSGFNVVTLMGASSVVGDTPGWTYKDLQAALDTMPEGCTPLDMYTTRGDLLRTLLCTDLEHYVDWNKGQCNFDSEDFREMLAFTKQFPAEIPEDLEWESSAARIAEGRQMLTTAYLYSIDSLVWDDAQYGELGCTYIGYPTNNGVGSYMSLSDGYAMSARCKDKDAGWEFLRSFLTEDAQRESWNGIPLSMKIYREKLEKAMTPEYEKDENGEYVLDENGERKQIPIGGSWAEDGTEIEIYCMTQEQADKLWQAVTTCNKVWEEDSAIYDIVFEQAQAYYAGQKTAEEVSRLIQNKVTIYINEQR